MSFYLVFLYLSFFIDKLKIVIITLYGCYRFGGCCSNSKGGYELG